MYLQFSFKFTAKEDFTAELRRIGMDNAYVAINDATKKLEFHPSLDVQRAKKVR